MHSRLKVEWRPNRIYCAEFFKIICERQPLHRLSAATATEWTSFTQLIQELVAGAVRRYKFSQWELDLLLDLQISQLRKSSRADALRRYLRMVLASQANGATEPPRFLTFMQDSGPRKAAATGAGSE
jgi:hypothetical protein